MPPLLSSSDFSKGEIPEIQYLNLIPSKCRNIGSPVNSFRVSEDDRKGAEFRRMTGQGRVSEDDNANAG